MKIGGRPEPVVVAITSDDLWLAVICQANLEIAGSPRKVYRDRLLKSTVRGKATGWSGKRKQVGLTKLRILTV